MAEEKNYLEQMLAEGGDRLLRLRRFAEVVGRHPETIKNHAKCGRLKLIKTSSRNHDIWLSEAVRYVRELEAA